MNLSSASMIMPLIGNLMTASGRRMACKIAGVAAIIR